MPDASPPEAAGFVSVRTASFTTSATLLELSTSMAVPFFAATVPVLPTARLSAAMSTLPPETLRLGSTTAAMSIVS